MQIQLAAFDNNAGTFLNFSGATYQNHNDGDADNGKRIPLEEEWPLPMRHPSKQATNDAEDSAEHCSQDTANNSENSSDDADENGEGHDRQNNYQDGRRGAL